MTSIVAARKREIGAVLPYARWPMSQERGNKVTCTECGAEREPELGQGAPRTPCPECGATTINVSLGVSEMAAAVSMTATLTAKLQPAEQARDWRRRWAEIERELSELLAPQQDGLSADAIHAARHRLHSFYIQAYHLKDALKEEASTTGVAKQAVEDAISADPSLALLADLANLDKHGNLNKPPRSGHVPRVVSESGTSGTDGPGWRLNLEIEHDGKILDGLQVADAAVAAWRRELTGWGLL